MVLGESGTDDGYVGWWDGGMVLQVVLRLEK